MGRGGEGIREGGEVEWERIGGGKRENGGERRDPIKNLSNPALVVDDCKQE